MEVVSAIAKVVQEIVKAAGTARENRERCLDLTDRARTVGDIIHHLDCSTASTISSGGGSSCTVMMREPALKRLKAALEEALELVESQQPGGFGSGVKKLITSGTTAAKFQRVGERITACVTDLGLAEQFAARDRALHANTGTGSAPSLAPEHHHQSSQFATSSSQQHRSFRCASSLPQHQSSQSATSLLQEHQSLRQGPSLRQGRSLRLSPTQQQQRSSPSTTPPLQAAPELASRPELAARPELTAITIAAAATTEAPVGGVVVVGAATELTVHAAAVTAGPELEAATPGLLARELASAPQFAARSPALPPSQQQQHLISQLPSLHQHQSSQPALPPRQQHKSSQLAMQLSTSVCRSRSPCYHRRSNTTSISDPAGLRQGMVVSKVQHSQ